MCHLCSFIPPVINGVLLSNWGAARKDVCVFMYLCECVYQEVALSLLHIVFLSKANRVGMATKANTVCEIY